MDFYNLLEEDQDVLGSMLYSKRSKKDFEFWSMIVPREYLEDIFDQRKYTVYEGNSTYLKFSSANLPDIALYLASENGHCKTVEMFLDRGVDPNQLIVFDPGRRLKVSSLHAASFKGHSDVVKILLKAGANPNPLCLCPDPLTLAAENNHTEVMELLLDAGAYIDASDDDRCNALSGAVENGFSKATKLLLERGANPDEFWSWVDGKVVRQTILHKVVREGYVGVTKTILEVKVLDPNVRDENGLTALEIASEKGHFEIVKILKKYGATE